MSSLPLNKRERVSVYLFLLGFVILWILPICIISILAFNKADYIGFPFKGFSLKWFFDKNYGIFHNSDLIQSFYVSVKVGLIVSLISVIIGLAASLYFKESRWKFKNFFYYVGISPLIIPGVILGIAILTFASTILIFFEDHTSFDPYDYLSPGFWLVVMGQISFISSYTMLIIQTQLKKFDKTWEEAALSLKATPLKIFIYITFPFLKPALIRAFIAGFLVSFSNFNTTVFLTGDNPTLPIYLFSQVKFNLTPEVNAISFLIIILILSFGILNFLLPKSE